MARRYQTKTHATGYGLEPCEEKYLIGGYEQIKSNVPPNVTWPKEFEQGFYVEGFGVLTMYLKAINSVRKRLGIPEIEFSETDVSAYVRNPDMTTERARLRVDDAHFKSLPCALGRWNKPNI